MSNPTSDEEGGNGPSIPAAGVSKLSKYQSLLQKKVLRVLGGEKLEVPGAVQEVRYIEYSPNYSSVLPRQFGKQSDPIKLMRDAMRHCGLDSAPKFRQFFLHDISVEVLQDAFWILYLAEFDDIELDDIKDLQRKEEENIEGSASEGPQQLRITAPPHKRAHKRVLPSLKPGHRSPRPPPMHCRVPTPGTPHTVRSGSVGVFVDVDQPPDFRLPQIRHAISAFPLQAPQCSTQYEGDYIDYVQIGTPRAPSQGSQAGGQDDMQQSSASFSPSQSMSSFCISPSQATARSASQKSHRTSFSAQEARANGLVETFLTIAPSPETLREVRRKNNPQRRIWCWQQQQVLFSRMARNYCDLFRRVPREAKDVVLKHYPFVLAYSLYKAFDRCIPYLRHVMGNPFQKWLLSNVSYWVSGVELSSWDKLTARSQKSKAKPNSPLNNSEAARYKIEKFEAEERRRRAKRKKIIESSFTQAKKALASGESPENVMKKHHSTLQEFAKGKERDELTREDQFWSLPGLNFESLFHVSVERREKKLAAIVNTVAAFEHTIKDHPLRKELNDIRDKLRNPPPRLPVPPPVTETDMLFGSSVDLKFPILGQDDDGSGDELSHEEDAKRRVEFKPAPPKKPKPLPKSRAPRRKDEPSDEPRDKGSVSPTGEEKKQIPASPNPPFRHKELSPRAMQRVARVKSMYKRSERVWYESGKRDNQSEAHVHVLDFNLTAYSPIISQHLKDNGVSTNGFAKDIKWSVL